jgi:hypothetical protein
MTSVEPAHGFAIKPEGSLSKSNSSSVTYRFKRLNDTSAANSDFRMP